jgi:hypothetical protein
MDHDNPYKELFSQPELIADLLRLAEMADGLDLASLDRRNGSYVSEDWKGREDDVVWRVRYGDRDLYVYLLIEFQSTVDALMAVRVMTYIGLLWQDLAKAGNLNPDGTLPPVLPLVLYNGEAPWTAARAIHEAMGPVPRLLQPFQPDSSFLLLDEVRMHLRDGHERNLAAAVFRLERSGDPAQHLVIARTVAGWLRGEGKVRIIAAFQRWYARTLTIKHSLPDTLNPFAEDPMLTTRFEEWKAGVIALGEAKGKAEGILALLRDRIDRQTLEIDAARAEVEHLYHKGHLTRDEADRVLTRLG